MKPAIILGALLTVILVAACADNYPVEDTAAQRYAMRCTKDISPRNFQGRVYRCENDEVICYDSGHGLQCQWKNAQKAQ